MNKQEAIELLRDVAQRVFYRTGRRSVHIDKIVELVNQIDEPQKVTIPKFVADFYESIKDDFEDSVQRLCVHGCEPVRKIDTWFDSDVNKPIQTLVKMKLYGYEIEKEKLYTVRIPNPNRTSFPYTLYRKDDGKIIIIGAGDDYEKREEYQLTEAEIKQDFDFLWQFAKEVEE